MRLTDATLCLDCQWLYDAREFRACPKCLNKYGMSLSRVLNRSEAKVPVSENVIPMQKRKVGKK